MVTLSQLVIPSSCELGGKIVYAGGKEPAAAANEVVTVQSVDQNKVVHETSADKNGDYKLPKLSPGNYSVVFAGRVQVNLRVVSGNDPQMELLNIAIPLQKPSNLDEMPEVMHGTGENPSGKK